MASIVDDDVCEVLINGPISHIHVVNIPDIFNSGGDIWIGVFE
eukprot:CAMPEP_0114600340 /NCGR_PEP_ID=MMETSP0125-20121206/22908_1 /TAXON_ID=485358 ORGANISM="Aristerostoma sp., Strain ATCC 50986" /NCGR_SAMPLE_ID=MMETSP0125 /ASSEMBLY_ACC=CAM_ASM_000245 /LENGTH=42 /DNA_ID= /DNA_START= /DNA_END= /DNA_ORIENTATION=